MMGTNVDVDRNPYNICTWDNQSDCDNCEDKNLLFCKLDKKLQYAFLILFAPCVVVAFFGLTLVGILTGVWWWLIVYGAFFIMLFPVIELGVLCRHCPYYAKSGRTLTCLASSGPKIYKYSPRPMNKWEHLGMYSYYAFLIGFPIFGVGYGIYFIGNNYSQYGKIALLGMIGIELALLFSMLAFNYCLGVYVCRKCVNFSCPWNRVDKPVVDEYLKKNPVMREAWEKTGYRIG
jgi:hypothetical protein